MVGSLRETTRANQEQDWLKTNLARISGLMQGHRDLPVVAELIMDELTPLVSAQYGAFYLAEDAERGPELRLVGSYGYPDDDDRPTRIPVGRSLVGQAARNRRPITVEELPAGYVTISSGLGQAVPSALVVLPIVVEEQVLGVIELASRHPLHPDPPGLPGAADADHRRQPQHHRGQRPHRRTAGRVPAPDRPNSRPGRRSCRSSRTNCSAPTPNWRRRPPCWPRRTATSRRRTCRSSRRGRNWRPAHSSCRWPPSTSRSSWPT